MASQDSRIKIGQVLRYPATKDTVTPIIGSYRNFFHVTRAPGLARVQLERGIDVPAATRTPTGPRRAVVLIRSSPWKAGSEQTPWHDVFDIDNGHVRYFGDHKPESRGLVGSTPGNRALLDAFEGHRGPTPAERAAAVPLLLFRAVRRNNQPKGHVEFCGLGLIERVERVVQWGGRDRRTFVNYVFDITLLELSEEDDQVDWRWINARRDPMLSTDATLALAPASWRIWVAEGETAMPRLRRRIARSAVQKVRDQRPAPGGHDEHALKQIYEYFHGKKHAFEQLAAAVAARVIRGKGADYREGWLTRPSQDGGADFVGRLDVGSGLAVTKLVVLGQAKCIAPESTISADQVARVVARLQRGWIGAYVTTGAFSESAQAEIIEDQYPILLINGLTLARQVRQIANENHASDLAECIDRLADGSTVTVVHRRPEEILLL